MSRSTKRLLVWAVLAVGLVALLNPGYSSVHVEGPDGVVRTQRFTFGPGSLIVFTRVTADDSSVRIEHH